MIEDKNNRREKGSIKSKGGSNKGKSELRNKEQLLKVELFNHS